jgi:hypothetical protein
VVKERRDKTGVRTVTKDDLQPGEKKRILELFVENDNTLSHLLEFISSKLVDTPQVPLIPGSSISAYQGD